MEPTAMAELGATLGAVQELSAKVEALESQIANP